MTEEEFAVKPLRDKWEHIVSIIDYVLAMDKFVGTKIASKDKERVRNLRKDQYDRWSHVKQLYASHRDEMVDTMGDEKYIRYQAILERVFTLEVDDALGDIIGD